MAQLLNRHLKLITGNDLEQRALACFNLARSIIASSNASGKVSRTSGNIAIADPLPTAEVLREAVPYLLRAEADFNAVEMYQAAGDIQYALAVVYHNMNLEEQRDAMSQKHMAMLEKRTSLEEIAFDEECWQILELVARVGFKLASR